MGFVEYMKGEYSIDDYTSFVNGTYVVYEDELVNSFWYARAPFVFLITGLYLLIALQGPKWMEKRKPFSIKSIMIIYNIYQVSFCAFYLYVFFVSFPSDLLVYIADNICHPKDQIYKSKFRYYTIHGSIVYLAMKILDLPDTIFMVLRKQNSHITFLHLFHHTTMVVSIWFHLHYSRGELGCIFGVLNNFVHMIMYGYYLLSAIGPRVRAAISPYKKYVTIIQISQFVIILSLLGYTAVTDCDLPPNLLPMWMTNNAIFLVLFINFYIRTFLMKNKNKKQ